VVPCPPALRSKARGARGVSPRPSSPLRMGACAQPLCKPMPGPNCFFGRLVLYSDWLENLYQNSCKEVCLC
jgi:hypothetical protein